MGYRFHAVPIPRRRSRHASRCRGLSAARPLWRAGRRTRGGAVGRRWIDRLVVRAEHGFARAVRPVARRDAGRLFRDHADRAVHQRAALSRRQQCAGDDIHDRDGPGETDREPQQRDGGAAALGRTGAAGRGAGRACRVRADAALRAAGGYGQPLFCAGGGHDVFHVGAVLGLVRCSDHVVIERQGDDGIDGRIAVSQGQRATVGIVAGADEPLVVPPIEAIDGRIDLSDKEWRDWTQALDWSGQLHCDGARRALAIRSALALKLLLYSPTGAIVAAATTSLPEKVGGRRTGTIAMRGSATPATRSRRSCALAPMPRRRRALPGC